MALAFSIRKLPKRVGGLRARIVAITLDTDYATPGYTITPANVGLTSKIIYMSPAVIGIYSASPTISGVNAILQMIVGAAGVNAEAADGLNGLDTQVGNFFILGW